MLGRTNGHLARKPLDISYSSTMGLALSLSLSLSLSLNRHVDRRPKTGAPRRFVINDFKSPWSCFTSPDNPPLLIIQSLEREREREKLLSTVRQYFSSKKREREREIKRISKRNENGIRRESSIRLSVTHSSQRGMFVPSPSSCNLASPRTYSKTKREQIFGSR